MRTETYPGSDPLVFQTAQATASDIIAAQDNPGHALAWGRHNLTNYDDVRARNAWAHPVLKRQANRIAAKALGIALER